MADRGGRGSVPGPAWALQGHGHRARHAPRRPGHGPGAAVKGALATLCVAAALVGCGDDEDAPEVGDDRGAGVSALGGAARVETVARTRLAARPSGPLAWVADEIRLGPGEEIQHAHELAFLYGRGDTRATPRPVAIKSNARHRHVGGGEGTAFWEIRLAYPGSPPAPGVSGGRRIFESDALRGIPSPAAVSLLAVTVPPRGGRTTVHTRPGPEFIYLLSGRIDYQNAIVGTRRLGPGGAEAIPPGTAVQKRNPYREPAVFLSWFLVDPKRPFAPRADFGRP
jgi:quercetin dioxygenase-like cupin family protein